LYTKNQKNAQAKFTRVQLIKSFCRLNGISATVWTIYSSAVRFSRAIAKTADDFSEIAKPSDAS